MSILLCLLPLSLCVSGLGEIAPRQSDTAIDYDRPVYRCPGNIVTTNGVKEGRAGLVEAVHNPDFNELYCSYSQSGEISCLYTLDGTWSATGTVGGLEIIGGSEGCPAIAPENAGCAYECPTSTTDGSTLSYVSRILLNQELTCNYDLSGSSCVYDVARARGVAGIAVATTTQQCSRDRTHRGREGQLNPHHQRQDLLLNPEEDDNDNHSF
ncbi:hypothetical protein C8R43DRAFT_943395 [Mycena crocata]|nr:hypothetical protein C8R43DRAFT_943395 [Mycena crocata]